MSRSVIIIGSGPAAYTAALYTARANLQPLILEGELSDTITPGGQLMTTTDIENFPGFPDPIGGDQLVNNMKEQASKFGAEYLQETVLKLEINPGKNSNCSDTNSNGSDTNSNGSDNTNSNSNDKPEYKVYTRENQYTAKCIIIATGATAKKLIFENSEKFWMKGISACAVCDGALPMFRNQVLAVIGGGDTACEEATFLSKFGKNVIMLVRKDKMRASKIMQARVLANPKIKILYNSEVVSASGTDFLNSIKVFNGLDKNYTEYNVAGLFFAIGHQPASEFLDNQLALNSEGYIITDNNSTKTSVPGIFAAGDVQDFKWRQAITAAASGCMAALECEHYLQ